MPVRLSVFIITYNEEKKLPRCLRSAAWADEIVVVDSLSQDRTAAVAKEYNCRVYTRPFTDYADQKNYAMSLARGDWLLSLDADEEITPELKDEILRALDSPEACEGYRIPRSSWIFGRRFRFTGTQDDRPMRLFKKGKAGFLQPIHEIAVVDGKSGCLKHCLNHYTYDSLGDYLRRLNRYTSQEAAYLSARQTTISSAGLLGRPLIIFLRLYLFRQGFRDGMQGFLFSVLSAFYAFLKHAKTMEIQDTSGKL
jgi:glycosyltransferase involved in cell wall biosynthesis